MPNEIIKERINILEPNYRTFVLSNSPSQITRDLAKVHNFDEEKYIVFENGFAMFLLFFINKSELVDYLITDCALKPREAELLAEALTLALPTEIRIVQENTSRLIFNETENTRHDDITQDIAETEAALQALEPIRTMTSDGHIPHQENIYTSTQSAILNEKTKKNDSSVDTPKWETN
jgi:hypothetical protein